MNTSMPQHDVDEMDTSLTQNDVDETKARLSRTVPFDKKWEVLKPAIHQLWVIEGQKLPDLIQNIEQNYGFFAM